MTEPDTDRLLVVAPDDPDPVFMGPNRITTIARAADTDGHYGLTESRAPVGSAPPLHVHHGVDEAIYLVRGRVRFRVGEREFTVGAGSFALLPRDVPHTFIVEGDEDAVMLAILSPGGSEQWFAEVGTDTPDAGPPDPEVVRAASEAWGAEMIGPPLTPRD